MGQGGEPENRKDARPRNSKKVLGRTMAVSAVALQGAVMHAGPEYMVVCVDQKKTDSSGLSAMATG